jgi:hypothetical protein
VERSPFASSSLASGQFQSSVAARTATACSKTARCDLAVTFGRQLSPCVVAIASGGSPESCITTLQVSVNHNSDYGMAWFPPMRLGGPDIGPTDPTTAAIAQSRHLTERWRRLGTNCTSRLGGMECPQRALINCGNLRWTRSVHSDPARGRRRSRLASPDHRDR